MLNSDVVINLLRKALHAEIDSVHQYFIYHRILEYKGYGKLAKMYKMLSIDEMKHADMLMGRILFLGGDISIHMSNAVMGTHDVVQMFEAGMTGEKDALELYNTIARESEERKDYETSAIVTGILADEERHYELQRQQFDVIGVVGLQTYIVEQIDVGNTEHDS